MLKLKRPVDAKFKVSSPFGVRILEGKKVVHQGIDFAVPIGTEVRACCDGIVFIEGYENPSLITQGLGYRIWQQFTVGKEIYYIWYGHLSKILVDENQSIKEGQVIALSGNTGHVVPAPTKENPNAGAHLHIQLCRKNTRDFEDIEFI